MVYTDPDLFNPHDPKTDNPAPLFVAWVREGRYAHWKAVSTPMTKREAWASALGYRMTAAVGERCVLAVGQLPGKAGVSV